MAGNEYLANEAAKFTARERIIIIPTCVEPAKYPVQTHSDRDGLQLVWVGSQARCAGWSDSPTLSAIGRAVPGTRLKLVCDRFLTIPDLPVDQCVWSEAPRRPRSPRRTSASAGCRTTRGVAASAG